MNGCWIFCSALGCREARFVSFFGMNALPAGKQVGVDLSWFICLSFISFLQVNSFRMLFINVGSQYGVAARFGLTVLLL